MRKLVLLLRRNFTLISFLVLQVISISFLVRYNKYHRVAFLGVANEITGNINSRYDKIDDYFHLREENIRVHRMNDSLLNLLPYNFIGKDSSGQLVTDSNYYDTSGRARRYYWRPAKVVANSVNSNKNYIQIDKGSQDGIRDNMTVVSSDGSLVGIVVNVSPNFSQIMSLLHVQRATSAMPRKSGNAGRLDWDGKDPRVLLLRRVPPGDTIHVGDTIVTSNFQEVEIPPGLFVGTVKEVGNEKATGDYLLKITPGANFQSIQQVFVIENLFYAEQVKLDKETRKKVEESDKRNS